MAIYRMAANDAVSVRLDSRAITVSGAVSAHVLAAVARAENDGQPITLDRAWTENGENVRRYWRNADRTEWYGER